MESTYAHTTEAGGAPGGAFGQISCEIDADLQAVIDAWPGLSKADRQAVLKIVGKVK